MARDPTLRAPDGIEEFFVPVIRPQAVLVLIVVIVVALFGVRDATSEPPVAETPLPTENDTLIALDATVETTAEPTTRPRPTSEVTPTATERPAPTERPEPTPTEEPETSERPAPPDTGLDGTSLIVERGSSGRIEVALTFDAGEGAGYTEEILDLLDEAGVVGSFGVTGEWVEANPDLTRRIVDDGHMLINHTWDHASWTGAISGTQPLGDEERRDQVRRTEQIIAETTGYDVAPYFRFPYGEYDRAALDLLGAEGYDYTLWWSCDTQGWNGYTPEQIVEICGPEAELGGPGAIILMHVADANDFGALPALIDEYAAADYDFVTLEEMIQP